MAIEDYHGSETPAEAFAKLARDGYCLFPKLFGDAEVNELVIRAMLHRADEQLRRERQEDGTIVHWSAAIDPVLDAVRSTARLFDIVGRLLGTHDIRQHVQQLHYRDQSGALTTRWRRDEHLLATRIASPRRNAIGTALILDDVTSIDQGAILFVPGSHEWAFDDPAEPAAYQRCEAMLPRRGMLALWNLGAIRGATPNRTSRDRRSLVQVYARADAGAAGLWTWRDGRALTYAEGKALG